MQKYLILQPNQGAISDGVAYEISRSNVDVIKDAWDNGHYRDAGYIKAKNLNDVFIIGNIEPEKVEKIDKFYSISCGDIIVDLSTKIAHLVAPIGFQPIRILR
jgi:hypothetical protein